MNHLSPSFRPQLYLPCTPYNERLPLTFLLHKWICLVRQKAAVSLHRLEEEQLVLCCGTRISSTSCLHHTHQSIEIFASVKTKKLGCLFKQPPLLVATYQLPPVLWNLISQMSHTAVVPKPFFFWINGHSWGNKRDQALAEVPSLDLFLWLILMLVNVILFHLWFILQLLLHTAAVVQY